MKVSLFSPIIGHRTAPCTLSPRSGWPRSRVSEQSLPGHSGQSIASLEVTYLKIVVLVAQLVSRHSCVADRLLVVVRFPAGPRVRLKYRRPAERKRARTKEKKLEVTHLMAVLSDGTIVGSHSRWSKNRAYFKILSSSSFLFGGGSA